MKRHVEEKELPYFAATLTAYLRESHPELLSDKHFIAERSDHAAQTYERAVRNGNSVYEALELSNAVLYQDLRFRNTMRSSRSCRNGSRRSQPGSAPLSA